VCGVPGAVVRADFGPIRIGDDVLIEDNVVLHGDPKAWISATA